MWHGSEYGTGIGWGWIWVPILLIFLVWMVYNVNTKKVSSRNDTVSTDKERAKTDNSTER
jgi:hypothetical protein